MGVALVTGVTGQDGSYLAELLSAEGTRVVGLSRSAPPAELSGAGLEFRQGSVEDSAFVERVVAETRPSHIYHFAGETSVAASFERPQAAFQSVAIGTLNVLEAARRAEAKPRVLVASSGEVFGNLPTPASEQSPLDPLSPYAAAKCAAVHLTRSYRRSYGLFASVAHFYNHESPRRKAHFVTKKIVRAACRIARGLEQRLELGDTSVVRDWGWAPEYVEAARRILLLDTPDDFVIATGTSVALSDFVDFVFSSLGLEKNRFVTTSPALFRPAEIPSMHADPTRAFERLGWRAAVTAPEVARRMVQAELEELDRKS